MSKKIKLLCFISYYLPGFRSGGPVRTLANFVEHLGEEFDIYIITRNHDFRSEPYNDVMIDQWNLVGKAHVFYASRTSLSIYKIIKFLNSFSFDVLYLNSFFDLRFSILPLLVRRFGLKSDVPCVIAPRGEFSKNAISLKSRRKRIYMAFAQIFDFYSKISWQASSIYEFHDISREFGVDPQMIFIASDLPSYFNLNLSEKVFSSKVQSIPLRVVFLSRITPIKNLHFAIHVLSFVRHTVIFTIYGPIEDSSYWHSCKDLIQTLPKNILVKYEGEIHPNQVSSCLASHDLFFFPTLGENYGHVIFEALAAGVPVLISDQTPWQDLTQNCVGWALPLDNPEKFAFYIEQVGKWNEDQVKDTHQKTVKYATEHLNNSNLKNANRALFIATASRSTNLSASIYGERDF